MTTKNKNNATSSVSSSNWLDSLHGRIAKIVHHQLWGLSPDPKAPENQNEDFQDGHEIGLITPHENKDLVWFLSFALYGRPQKETPEWNNWKRGFYVGQLHALAINSENPSNSELAPV